MSRRKVIQITGIYDHSLKQQNLFALCNDGSIFGLSSDADNESDEWWRLPEIPQEKVNYGADGEGVITHDKPLT